MTGMTNFENLPENIVLTRLREARQVAAERKGSVQFVAGSNLHYFRTNNSGTYAWTGQADYDSPQSPGTGGAFFTVTLTSVNAPIFLNDLVVELFVSTDSGATWQPASDVPSVFPGFNVRPATPIGITPFKSAWLLGLTATLNTYLAFKVQALTTDEVSIGVVRSV